MCACVCVLVSAYACVCVMRRASAAGNTGDGEVLSTRFTRLLGNDFRRDRSEVPLARLLGGVRCAPCRIRIRERCLSEVAVLWARVCACVRESVCAAGSS